MVNPTLSQKESSVFTVSDRAKDIFKVIYQEQTKEEKPDDEPKIRVSEVISKMAFYYEKIRNSVDYKEENLLHKNAVERILKRQINIEQLTDAEEIAKTLLSELIRAGYLPNNRLPETKIGEIKKTVDKYVRLREAGLLSARETDKKILSGWVIAMAACEIAERLNLNPVNETVIRNMYDTLVERIELPENSPFKKDKEIQLFLSIHLNYLKSDRDMLAFILLKYYVADWQEASEETISKAGGNIDELYRLINYQLDHPLAGQYGKIVSKYTVYFSILAEVISDNPVEVYENFKKDPKAFARLIKNACAKRYKSTRAKLWRAAIRSIIYLFLTKMLLVLILEIPVSRLLGETSGNLALAINVSFPPLLLFLIVLSTRLPSDKNTSKVIEGIEEFVFAEKMRLEPIKLRPPQPRSKARNIVFSVIYAVTFFLSFGFVIVALDRINFHFISITIFLFFLALISFFSIRIRKRVRELLVVEPGENIFSLLVDFFYVPVIAAGKWLSEKFSRLNVLVFILDFIIEAPFKLFVEITEEWARYVKERKEDVSQ